MKKALAVLLVLSLLAATLLAGIALAAGNDTAANWSEAAVDSWYTGQEQQGNEFTITTPEQLAGLAKLVNAGTTFSGKTVKLGADINLEGKEWTPIGDSSHYFEGTFDGGEHTITGLNFHFTNLVEANTNLKYSGFFGYVKAATLKNFTLTDVDVSSNICVSAVTGYVGAPNETTTTTISNVTVSDGQIVSTADYAAGFVVKEQGITTLIFENCTNGADVTIAHGTKGAAFLSNNNGPAEVKLTDCHNTGKISVTNIENTDDGDAHLGGLVCYAQGPVTMNGCSNSGDLYSKATYSVETAGGNVGGLLSTAQGVNVTMTECTNTGDIVCERSGSDAHVRAGGLIGRANSGGTGITISNCSQVGSITVSSDSSSGESNAGLVIGYTDNYAAGGEVKITVTGTTADGSVTVTGPKCFRGLFVGGVQDGYNIDVGSLTLPNLEGVPLVGGHAEDNDGKYVENRLDGDDGKIYCGSEIPENVSGAPYEKDEEGNLIPSVAKVGEEYFTTLSDALTKAGANGTVTLVKDVSLTKAVEINSSVTIDGNGHTLTRGKTAEESTDYTGTFFAVSGNVKLTLSGVSIDAGGKWTLDEAKYEAALEASKTGTSASNAAEIIKTDGAVETTDHLITLADGASLDVKGGSKITNFYTKDKHIVQITNGAGSVTLTDCVISHGASANQFIVNDGDSSVMNTITVGSGCVIEDNFVYGNGGLFLVGCETTLEVTDGAKIIDNTTVGNGTVAMIYDYAGNGKENKMIMSGGEISRNVGIYVGANHFCSPIYVHQRGEFVMSGGSITDNIGGFVGAIMENERATKVEITGGTVKDNYYVHSVPEAMAKAGYPSAGMGEIFIGADATFGDKAVIEGDLFVGMGGQLENNGTIEADTYVYASKSEDIPDRVAHFNNNGTVNGTLTAQNGATVNNSGTVDELVVNNTVEKKGSYTSTNGKITNTDSGTIDGTVTLGPDTSITLGDEELTAGANGAEFTVDGTTVTLAEGTLKTEGKTSKLTFKNTEGNTLTPTGDDNIVMVPAVQVISGETTTDYDSLQSALAAAKDGDTVELLKDITVEGQKITVDKAVTITSATGHTYQIKRGETCTEYMLNLTANGEIKLTNVIVDGGSGDGIAATRAMIAVNKPEEAESLKLVLDTGAVLRNNNNAAPQGAGGALCVISGSVEMNTGATISGNKAAAGGGVALMDSGTMTMNGGEITGNTAVDHSSEKIGEDSKGNDVFGNSARGGAVYAVGDGKDPYNDVFIMNGGKISNNSSENDGGAFCVWAYAIVTINDGEISNNTCKDYGGVIYSYASKTVFKDGLIQGNKAYGGGVAYMSGAYSVNPRSYFEMTGGTITGNSAEAGGAFFVNNYATFTMSGGRITGNTAEQHGGGFMVAPGAYSGTEPMWNILEFSGTPYITGNTGNDDTGADNLYMDGNLELPCGLLLPSAEEWACGHGIHG